MIAPGSQSLVSLAFKNYSRVRYLGIQRMDFFDCVIFDIGLSSYCDNKAAKRTLKQ